MHFNLWGSVCEFPFLEFPLVKFPLMTFPLMNLPLVGLPPVGLPLMVFKLWGFSVVTLSDTLCQCPEGRLWRCSDIQFMSMLGTWCRFANNAMSMFCGAFYVNILGRIHGNGVGSVSVNVLRITAVAVLGEISWRCSEDWFMSMFWYTGWCSQYWWVSRFCVTLCCRSPNA